jgi:iron complex outermembrane receptor protein
MRKNVFLLAALTCAAGSVAAAGRTGKAVAPKPGKTMTQVDSVRTYSLQAVEVVSTRAAKTTPMAFTNVDQQQLRGVNYGQDVPYLLQLTPSVTLSSDAGNGIGYTTLRVRGTDPGRINITVNGIPQNDAESSQLYWVNMGDLASNLQGIQIQRGVGTSTNGAGAFGATVNMQTENIGNQPYVTLDASAGSYYSHKETLRFGTGLLGGHWGFQGRLSNIGSKGYVRRASTKLNSYFLQGGYFSDNTMVKFVTFNGQEQTYHAWDYASKYQQSEYGRRYNPCGEYYDKAGNTLYYKNQTDNYHQQNYQLILSQRLSDLFDLHAALHYTKGQGYYEQYRYHDNYANYGLSETKFKSDLIRQKKMDNDFYGAVADVNYNDQQHGLKATLGGGWNKYDGDHYGLITWAKEPQVELLPDYRYYWNNAKKTDGNIYGKVNWEFAKGLSAFVDLQYRHVMYKLQNPSDAYGTNDDRKYIYKDNFDFFNPKFGANWQIDRHNNVYVSYAIAHREPTRTNYKDYASNQLSYPKAERLNDLEVGYAYRSEKFSAQANYYYMYYHNQFVLTGELDPIGNAITRNVEKSYRTGVELQAAWMPCEYFRWDANATFSRNRVKDMKVTLDDAAGTVVALGDKPLSFSPDAIFNNIWSFMYKGFDLRIVERYVGRQYLTNTGFKHMQCTDAAGNTTYETLMLGDHWTTDLNLDYHFAWKKMGIKNCTVGVSLYNLFSKKYDNNGWAAPQFEQDANGGVIAVNTWGTRDDGAAGFAASAPFNCMAHLSITF